VDVEHGDAFVGSVDAFDHAGQRSDVVQQTVRPARVLIQHLFDLARIHVVTAEHKSTRLRLHECFADPPNAPPGALRIGRRRRARANGYANRNPDRETAADADRHTQAGANLHQHARADRRAAVAAGTGRDASASASASRRTRLAEARTRSRQRAASHR
jgi:hypothetical protein